jgi:TPR repeat protein
VYAAYQGFGQAQIKLGFLFENGRGVAQSDADALRWFKTAAANGFIKAKEFLNSLLAQISDNSIHKLRDTKALSILKTTRHHPCTLQTTSDYSCL